MNPSTGAKVWEYKLNDVSDGGIVTTAGNVLFSGNREDHFFALDATSGKLLGNIYLAARPLPPR